MMNYANGSTFIKGDHNENRVIRKYDRAGYPVVVRMSGKLYTGCSGGDCSAVIFI